MEQVKCKKCGSENKVKNGFVRSKQRYYCKDCHCQFTDTKPRGKPPELKKNDCYFAFLLRCFVK